MSEVGSRREVGGLRDLRVDRSRPLGVLVGTYGVMLRVQATGVKY